MNITIVGGGNVGTQFAVHCSEKKHNVIVFTSKPDKFCRRLSIVDEKKNVIHQGEIYKATNNVEVAFSNAELIFITMPAYCMEDIAAKIFEYVKPGTYIGLIPGTGGGECAFKECIKKGCVVFGLQRVPSVARLTKYGEEVCATGYRDTLYAGAIPKKYTQNCCDLITKILDMPCYALPNYLNVTLTPSNPILHTSRLYSLFKEYKEGTVYEKIPLFYEEWDEFSSDLLLKCDEEVQSLCLALKEFDLSFVKSLKEHYESYSIEQMTKKIRSIESLKGLETPNIIVGDKYMPDFSSRYFTADFPYGLTIILQIAELVDKDMKCLKQIWEWYENISENGNKFRFSRYNIENYNEFRDFYNR